MTQRLRIFVSSPTDVPDERLRTDLVVDKLSQDYARFFTIESYRWEHEAMLAFKHFQDVIEPPSAFDIVVLILWSRLGTPLPEKTAEREYRGIDGRAPVTGTEWEYEEALKAARERGAPDLLAFRNVSPAPIDPSDPGAQARSIAQLNALNAFWTRHFVDRGVFLAAYDQYRTLEEFAHRLEESLRRLIERRIKTLAAGESRAPIWIGDPFRGLESYEFEHAKIFFGRDAAVMKAAEQLAADTRSGCAFLLISGASGSGKSSLVKAGIVPRLMRRQRISGKAFLRRAVFRPGSASGDVFLGFAQALTQRNGDNAVGLPELIAQGQDAGLLARHLRGSEPGYLFANALGRLTQSERGSGRLLAFEDAMLIVVVDQLEELFTASSIAPDDRRLFVQLLAGLARSGSVWVIASLRADFWHRAVDIPELAALAEGQGRLDLAVPTSAELAEIIRKPVQAAGLSFEEHPESGLGLDAVLAQGAAAAPGALPLLSFTLDELYRAAKARGETVLRHANYEILGGLEGAIANRADATLAGLSQSAQMALPRVLRALTTIAGAADQASVAQSAPFTSFVEGSPSRTLVDAFIAARLLVVASEHDAPPTVRLAHEALIGRWQRARDQLVIDRRDLETRTLVERQLGRWSRARGREQKLLLLRNPDLANAVDLARRWGDEIDAPARSFIARSARRARLAQTLTVAVAVLFAVLAGVAVYAERQAVRARQDTEDQRQRAERALQTATETANTLVLDMAKRLRGRVGMPIDLVRDILDRAQELMRQLAERGETSAALRYSAAQALNEVALTLLEQGDAQSGADAASVIAIADRCRTTMNTLVANDPDNRPYQFLLSLCDSRIGDAFMAMGEPGRALEAFQDGFKVRKKLVSLDPGNAENEGLATSYMKIGDALLAIGGSGNEIEADRAYRASLQIRQELVRRAPQEPDRQRALAISEERMGYLENGFGHPDAALKYFLMSLTIRQELSERYANNVVFLRDLAVTYQWIGDIRVELGQLPEALDAFRASLEICKKIALANPSNYAQRELAISLARMGDMMMQMGRGADAIEWYRQSLDIREKLSAADPDNAVWQTDLIIDLRRLARAGDQPRARLSRALEIARRLRDQGKLRADQAGWIETLEKELEQAPT